MSPPAQDEESHSWVLRHRKTIIFLTICLSLAGVYAAFHMPSSVFPQTDFPRVVILIDNGVMPSDEMMATITRPVEEAMKDIPGTREIRSATGRGAAEVNVFFEWSTDMVQAELYVLGRLGQIRADLPAEMRTEVHRLTFATFPVLGVSMTSERRSLTDLWELANYDLRPRFLRIPGVAQVKLVGGRVPEFHVIVDPLALQAHHMSLTDVSAALERSNLFLPAGMHEEDYQLYLNVVDNRIHDPADIEKIVVSWSGPAPVRVGDIATVRHGAAPQYNIVSADGREAVLFNVYGQPDSDTLAIAAELEDELTRIEGELAGDVKLAFYYDQSQFVREGQRSVWESIIVGLGLSSLVLFGFLRSFSATFVAAAVIPVTTLFTLVALRLMGMSFNLMTLGGIAAAVGLIIDDAIVVVEAIHAKVQAGHGPARAVGLAIREVGLPLVGSTLTPIVVFLPLSVLDGVPGVFFRALALTMVFAILSSLLLAVTWTPTLGALLLRPTAHPRDELEQGGPLLRGLIRFYEWTLHRALRHPFATVAVLLAVAAGGASLYRALETDFLPAQDEGAFVLDYFSRPGTSLSETDRMLRHVEQILGDTPEVESYSRRTGARLALAIAEPNTGDFLVKLRSQRSRSTSAVIDDLRERIQAAEPALNTEFPGVLSDLIGDLTWSAEPVEIKIFSTDPSVLERESHRIAALLETVPGVVDINDGLVVAGSSLSFRVRGDAAARAGLSAAEVGSELQTALLGTASSYALQGDRTIGIRVLSGPAADRPREEMLHMPLQTPTGAGVTLQDLAEVRTRGGLLEMHRENLRQLVAVSARFSGIGLGTGIARIRAAMAERGPDPAGAPIEFGGLYQQQEESFNNLGFVLALAILLVYGVLLAEFRSVLKPLAIVFGAVLALVGTISALWLTGISLNIVSFLGAIIGVGIVAKNGILMLDYVDHLQLRGLSLRAALVQSGRRRLRPVLMTSMTAMLGLLPLAWGVGAGADMLRPLAVAVIGAISISLPLSLIATPVVFFVLVRILRPGLLAVRPDAE